MSNSDMTVAVPALLYGCETWTAIKTVK